MQRPIGWNQATALYMEPGLARLVGFVEFTETGKENESLMKAVRGWYTHQLAKHKADVDGLRNAAGSAIQADHSFLIVECVSLYNPGIARRLCPQIFELENADGLVEVAALDRLGAGVYRAGELAVFAHHYLRRALSPLNSLNAPFLDCLEGLDPKLRPRVAIDPDIVGLAATRRPVIEHQYWWGPNFDDDLAEIEPGLTQYGASDSERFFHGISRTDFWWQSRKGEHIFEVEELRDAETFSPVGNSFGCRYAHAIVPEATGIPAHFDGAIRTYSDERMAERLDLKIADARRDLPYQKLWRVDGEIPVSTWKRLLSDYYRDNHLVGEYLGAPANARSGELSADRSAADPHSIAVTPARSPHDERLADFNGPRAVVSLQPPRRLTVEREVVPFRTLKRLGTVRPVVEMQTVNLVKQLRRLGASITVPEGLTIISPDDLYYNIAPIWHRDGVSPRSS